jgi:antitoxin HicB
MNKDLEYYLELNYKPVIEETPTGEFFATIPELPGCMATSETRDQVLAAIEDAKLGWLKAALDSEITIREPERDKAYSGRILFRTSPIIHGRLIEEAKNLGLRLNTYLNMLVIQNRCLFDMTMIQTQIKKRHEVELRDIHIEAKDWGSITFTTYASKGAPMTCDDARVSLIEKKKLEGVG